MEHARIALFEDQENIRQLIAAALDQSTHEIVAEASTVDEALQVVDQVERGDLNVDVILLDGNLDSGQMDCSDARRIAAEIKDRGIPAVIIGFSAYRLQRFGVPVDIDATKANASRITEIISSI